MDIYSSSGASFGDSCSSGVPVPAFVPALGKAPAPALRTVPAPGTLPLELSTII